MENLTLKLPNGNSIQVESKTELLWWQERGLMETATGYGRKLTTSRKIKWGNRWYRVYCACFSNIGTCYIISHGQELIVD